MAVVLPALVVAGLGLTSAASPAAAAADPVGTVSNFTGTGISNPRGIATGPDGNLWFTNYGTSYFSGSIGRITPDGVVSNFSDPNIHFPMGIVAGPDGNLWFANFGGNTIGRITPDGVLSFFDGPGVRGPSEIIVGPDGNLWFTNNSQTPAFLEDSIGRITTSGVVTAPVAAAQDPTGIAAGPDGSLWYTNYASHTIGRYSPTTGQATTLPLPGVETGHGPVYPHGIATGADGNLWFTNQPPPNASDGSTDRLGRITPSGVVTMFDDASLASPFGITSGLDGNLWFTNFSTFGSPPASIGRVSPTGVVSSFTGPGINGPYAITKGPDSNLWFTNSRSNSIGRIVSGGPSAPPAPSPPSAPSAAAGAPGSAVVSWTASSDGTSGPLTYTATSSPGGYTCTTSDTSCTVSGLSPLTGYTFTVTATNAAGTVSAASTATSPAVTPGPAPVPVISSVVVGDSKATVSWSALTPTPDSYLVLSKQGKVYGPTCIPSNTASCQVDGLTNGKPYTFVVQAIYPGGSTSSAASGSVVPKVMADLAAASIVPPSLTVARSGSLTAVEAVTNNGPDASHAKMTLTVVAGTETGVTADPGLSCAVPAPDVAGTGFTQVCTTDTPLAPGETRYATVTLAPPVDPGLRAMKVTNAVSLPVTAPVTYKDPVSTNNKVAKTLKIMDSADLSASFVGAPTVARGGSYEVTGTLTNNGTDPVFAKLTIPVTNATESAFTADAGLNCVAPVPNAAGTGYTRTCLTILPLAPGASLQVHLTLTPSATPTVRSFTIAGVAAKASGNVIDAVVINNRSSLKVLIT